MYIYNYFIILLGVYVSYDTQFDTIHDTKKSKIDSRYNSQVDNYVHENEFKCFSKIGDFNLELQNKIFNHQNHNFCQPLTIFCIKHHRKHNLGWPNQIHHNFMY